MAGSGETTEDSAEALAITLDRGQLSGWGGHSHQNIHSGVTEQAACPDWGLQKQKVTWLRDRPSTKQHTLPPHS